jgi:hypothetical protein
LPHRSVYHGVDQGVVGFKGFSEMVRHMRGHRAIQQRRSERLVAAADFTLTESRNEIIAAHSERSGAIQNEPSDGIFVFSETPLKCPSG